MKNRTKSFRTPPMATFLLQLSLLAPSCPSPPCWSYNKHLSELVSHPDHLPLPVPGQRAHYFPKSFSKPHSPVGGCPLKHLRGFSSSQIPAGSWAFTEQIPQQQPFFQPGFLSAGSCGFGRERSRCKAPPSWASHHLPPTSKAGASPFPMPSSSQHHDSSPCATTWTPSSPLCRGGF